MWFLIRKAVFRQLAMLHDCELVMKVLMSANKNLFLKSLMEISASLPITSLVKPLC